jgi:hypothetical protein
VQGGIGAKRSCYFLVKKFKHPTMIELDVINHIVKFHLPSKLQGSPRWHKSHLQDLLTMVANFGMPQF